MVSFRISNTFDRETVITDVVNTEVQVNSSIEELVDSRGSDNIVGLDTEWMFKPSILNGEMASRVAVLQLCISSRCVIVQLHLLDSIPSNLRRFLSLPDVTFVGVRIMESVVRLNSQYGLECRNWADLGTLASSYNKEPLLNYYGLLDLDRHLLPHYYDWDSKPLDVTCDWGEDVLSEAQIKWASYDAYVSAKLGRSLLLHLD